jgi:alginate O-acetyltransferase complex protein AlgJ
MFLLAIFGLPLSQMYWEKKADEESPLLDLFKRPPTAENLHQFEHDIEEASYAKAYVQPRLQQAMTGWGRVGNKRATIGRNGWLYYTPGVEHVAGPGFLQADTQVTREKAALDAGEAAIEANPLPAILDFHRFLAARGIRLVLMPMPDKAALESTQLHGRRVKGAVDNRDAAQFIRQLQLAGVAIFDARASVPQGEHAPLFLVQDTHYTPTWMERLAVELGRFVSQVGGLPPLSTPPSLKAAAQVAARVGDIVDMLKLPEQQQLFTPQTVTVHQVQTAEGNPWEPDSGADVLLLGDSFTNIFTLEGMGWGAAAGLGPQLSLALARPVDVIAQNDSGAFATRQALARELGAGTDRLAGKRVVIWEFASRELSTGDWKHIDWSHPARGKDER